MPLAGSSTSFQQCAVAEHEQNAVPMCAPRTQCVSSGRSVGGSKVAGEQKPTQVGEVGPRSSPWNCSSFSGGPLTAPNESHLPLNLSNAIDAEDVRRNPRSCRPGQSPADAYFDSAREESPMSRFYMDAPCSAIPSLPNSLRPVLEESSSNRCDVNSCDGYGSPLARWINGADREKEAGHADALWSTVPMGPTPDGYVPGQVYFTPFTQPLMWSTATIMGSTLQPTLQPVVLVPPAMPQQAMQQQVMPPQGMLTSVFLQGQHSDFTSRDVAVANSAQQSITSGPTTGKVWERKAVWKAAPNARQSSMDLDWKRKDARSQFSSGNQPAVKPRAKNATSKKPADKNDSGKPRAVFVDLSKIVPREIVD